MNCPKCGAPDFSMTCGSCYLLAPRAIQEVRAVVKAIEGRSSVPTAELIQMLEASGALKAKDVRAILRGVFKQNVEVISTGTSAALAAVTPAPAAPAPPGICPSCGGKNFVWARKCDHCGHALLVIPSADAPAKTTRELFEKAAALCTIHERFTDALACLQTIIDREPAHVAALMLKGDVHGHLNQFDQATDCYKRAQAAQPDDAAAVRKMDALTAYLKGGHERYKKQPPQALEWYSRAVELDPRNFTYLFAKGLLLWELKRHGEALFYLEQGLQLVPRSASVDVRWAKFSALAELQLVADALALGREILPRMPDGTHKQSLAKYLRNEPPPVTRPQIAGAWLSKGIAAQKEQRLQDAVEFAYRAAWADPADPAYKAFLGSSLVMLGCTTKNDSLQTQGLASLLAALGVRRDPSTLFNYMQSLHMMGRLQDALTVADELLTLTPDDSLVMKVEHDIKQKLYKPGV